MRKKSLITRNYIVDVLVILFVCVLYKILFGTPDIKSSLMIASMIIMVFSADCFVSLHLNIKGYGSMNGLVAFGVFTWLMYQIIYRDIYNNVLKTTCVLLVIVLALSMGVCIHSHLNNTFMPSGRINRLCLVMAYRYVRYILLFSALEVIIIALVFCFTDKPHYSSKSTDYSISENETYDKAFEDHIDSLMVLIDGSWEVLDEQQKLNILKLICDIQCRKLGVDKDITIKSERMDNMHKANYSDESSLITINKLLLEDGSASNCAEAIIHQCRHAGQYALLRWSDMLNDTQKNSVYMHELGIPEFREELSNDIDGEKNGYDRCADQAACEEDARTYAFIEVGSLYWILNNNL